MLASKSRFGEGDIVYVRIHDGENKVSPKFSGPHRTLAAKGDKAMMRSIENHEIRNVLVEHFSQVSWKLAGYDASQAASNGARNTQLSELKVIYIEDNKGRPGRIQDNAYKQNLRSHLRSTIGTVCQQRAVYYPQ